MIPETSVDFLVIGSGVAGLTYALETAKRGSTLILTKKNRAESNSNYAQGGIAGVMASDDSTELHAEDTEIAGAGLCHHDAVEVLVTEGPERIEDLIRLGACFNHSDEVSSHFVKHSLSLGREGGHSRNRIVHAADRTGWECERALLTAAKDAPNLEVLEHYFVLDLAISSSTSGSTGSGPARCLGAYALDPVTAEIRLFRARKTFLATGGSGQVYRHTTNPAIATGDGVAMAWRAGASLANMEFVQFHPTALFHPEGRSFLISEAVRGEGGILRTADGSTFMENYHPLGALAPRDIVARAIHAERMKRGEPCVFLDVTHLDSQETKERFPTIYNRCLELGIDITRQPIPVVPAAHYQCGGVITDLNGLTTLPNLYAAGEVACTGVHGANRLASNSLLEAMVFGRRAALHATYQFDPDPLAADSLSIPTNFPEFGEKEPDLTSTKTDRVALSGVMNDYAGIVRNDRELLAARETVDNLGYQIDNLVLESRPHPDLWEQRNLVTVARLILLCASLRKESRGLHYTTDYLKTDDLHWKRDTLLK